MFASKPAGGGLFGASQNNNAQQSSSSLFGNTQQNQQQQGGGLFGSLSQNNQQSQPAAGGLFAQNNAQPQQQTSSLFGNTQQPQQNQQGTGLFGGFGASTQQQTGGMFGQSQQNQNSGFGGQQQQNGFGGSILGGQQQQQGQGGNNFTGSTAQPLPQLGQSPALWQPQGHAQEKSIQDQMMTVLEKWDTMNPNCVFKHYFYNKVDDNMTPYYTCPPNENATAWEEALQKKPGSGYIPVLCTGFQQLGERIELQQRNLASFNGRLHEINDALSAMMQNHETKTSIRAMDARRKHIVLKRRCLALATKVQVLRNRGYAMGTDEDELKSKLQLLEKEIQDPGLDARGEEIWARMLLVQERARILKTEFERAGGASADMLDEATSNKAKKILEDYNTQLQHLRTEVESISKELNEWQKNQLSGSQKQSR